MRIDAIAPAQTAAKPDPKLVDGARQFEAMMLGEMLKGMSFGGSPDADGSDDAQTGASGTIRSFGTEAVAKALASTGSFGLAQQIVRQVQVEHEAVDQKRGGTKVL